MENSPIEPNGGPSEDPRDEDSEAFAVGTTAATPGERAFLEFMQSRGGEDAPIRQSFEAPLSAADQDEFAALLGALDWTEQRLPAKLPDGLAPESVLDDRYRLIEVLGSGGMGQVWRAEDTKLQKPVAVKVLNLLGVEAIRAEITFEREGELLAKLNHPGIISILESGEAAGYRYLVMDLVEGRPLNLVLEEARLRKRVGPVSGRDLLGLIGRDVDAGRTPVVTDEGWYEACAKVMVELLRTLESAHGRGVVHRDLKPANIMLCGGANPMLLDFGIGGQVGKVPGLLTSGMFGSPPYIAPEQWDENRIGSDPRTDVYQLGLILYEMLTLRGCFPKSISQANEAITKGRFPVPRTVDAKIPKKLENICLRAMELDPARRYQSVEAYREDLQAFLRGDRTSVENQTLLRDLRYFCRRNRRRLTAAAGIAATVLITWGIVASLPDFHLEFEGIGTGDDPGVRKFNVNGSKARRLYACATVVDAASKRYLCPVELAVEDQPFKPADSGVFVPKGKQRVRARYPEKLAKSRMQPVWIQVIGATETEREDKVKRAIHAIWRLMESQGDIALPFELALELWGTAMRGDAPGPRIDGEKLFGQTFDDAGFSGRGFDPRKKR